MRRGRVTATGGLIFAIAVVVWQVRHRELSLPASGNTDDSGRPSAGELEFPAAQQSGVDDSVLEVSGTTFEEEVLREDALVLLDFWAEWCWPCRELEPVLIDTAREFRGSVKICRINVEENGELAANYVPDNVLPCLILVKGGQVVDRRSGTDPELEPAEFLRRWLRANLAD